MIERTVASKIPDMQASQASRTAVSSALARADEAEDLLRRCGLRVAEHPDRATLQRRYFARRTDSLAAWSTERVIVGAVDPP